MYSLSRRQFVNMAAGSIAAAVGAPVWAQDYPSRPIRLVVPTPAGSGPDADIRQIAQRLVPLLGQPVVIDNRPGASTRIATELVAKSAPDGYTLLLATPSMVTAPFLYEKLAFDPRRDLIPVSLLSETYYTLAVNTAVPVRTAAEFVAQARANPALANVATYGVGTIPHLAGAWFAALTGANFNFIHYNASSPFNDLLAGQTQAMFDAMLPVIGGVKSGRLRLLGVSGKSRQPALPDTPTFAEAGYDRFNPVVWVGVVAPSGTPQAVVKRLSDAFAQAAKVPEIVSSRRDAASKSVGSTPEEFGSYLNAEGQKWGSVIRQMGLKLES